MEAAGGLDCVSRPLGQWQLTSTVGEPPAGLNPDVVLWSGTALFVIGYSTAGGKYDPCLDKWQPFPAHPMFTSLVLATSSGAYFVESTGGTPTVFSRFDFGTFMWQQLSIAGYPAAADHGGATAMVGSRLVRWGGVAMLSSPYVLLTNSGSSSDPAADRWQSTSTDGAPSERVVDTNGSSRRGLSSSSGVARESPGGQAASCRAIPPPRRSQPRLGSSARTGSQRTALTVMGRFMIPSPTDGRP